MNIPEIACAAQVFEMPEIPKYTISKGCTAKQVFVESKIPSGFAGKSKLALEGRRATNRSPHATGQSGLFDDT